jgi:hypothetical protein
MSSQDSSIGIATGWGLDGRGSFSGKGKEIFRTSQRPDRIWGHPHSFQKYRGGGVLRG